MVKSHEAVSDLWRTVTAVVEGPQIVPDCAAKIVKIRIPNAPTGSDVCIECAPHIHRVTVEVTPVTVKEEGIAEALVINTSGSPVSLKHGVRLCQCLVYWKKVLSEPAEYPSAQVSGITSACQDTRKQDTATLEAFLKIAHYSEIQLTLIQVFEQYKGALALPGEPLRVTQCAEHHIKLQADTNHVYINAYKLPHSQREVV